MQKWKWMVFLDVVEKLDEGQVNEKKCKHLKREVQKKQREWYLEPLFLNSIPSIKNVF